MRSYLLVQEVCRGQLEVGQLRALRVVEDRIRKSEGCYSPDLLKLERENKET
jgi:hypothetical protein